MRPAHVKPAAYLVWVWDTATGGPLYFSVGLDEAGSLAEAHDDDDAFHSAAMTPDPLGAKRFTGLEAAKVVGRLHLSCMVVPDSPPVYASGYIPVEMARALARAK